MKTTSITTNGTTIHLVLGKTVDEWEKLYGENDDIWNFPYEEFLDGSVEINEDIWYWYIDGRCYETDDLV